MPISSGFGRGLNIFRRRRESPQKVSKVKPVMTVDNPNKQFFEVYQTHDPYLPPDRNTEEKLVIVKPIMLEKFHNVPVAPNYVVEKQHNYVVEQQPKRQSMRRYQRVSFDDESSARRSRCCKSVKY
jgi:hypothetical protein